eukprot:731680-Prorocentrum_minimum.AAC.1
MAGCDSRGRQPISRGRQQTEGTTKKTSPPRTRGWDRVESLRRRHENYRQTIGHNIGKLLVTLLVKCFGTLLVKTLYGGF